ncbi:hypothetical protein N9N03_00820 [Chlamydiia bacterium]|nr:hypothetical protein [Chlamydiia bacterium]
MDVHEKLSGYVLNLVEYNDRMHFLSVFTETGKHTISVQKRWLNKPDFLSTSGTPCMVKWLCKKNKREQYVLHEVEPEHTYFNIRSRSDNLNVFRLILTDVSRWDLFNVDAMLWKYVLHTLFKKLDQSCHPMSVYGCFLSKIIIKEGLFDRTHFSSPRLQPNVLRLLNFWCDNQAISSVDDMNVSEIDCNDLKQYLNTHI